MVMVARPSSRLVSDEEILTDADLCSGAQLSLCCSVQAPATVQSKIELVLAKDTGTVELCGPVYR